MKIKKYKADDFFVRGIYFLYLEDKIVYIGKSNSNVMSRIARHDSDAHKIFDSFSFVEYDNFSDKQLSALEAKLIKRHMPALNVTHHPQKQKKRKNRSVYLKLR